jgi:hypothetical protein
MCSFSLIHPQQTNHNKKKKTRPSNLPILYPAKKHPYMTLTLNKNQTEPVTEREREQREKPYHACPRLVNASGLELSFMEPILQMDLGCLSLSGEEKRKSHHTHTHQESTQEQSTLHFTSLQSSAMATPPGHLINLPGAAKKTPSFQWGPETEEKTKLVWGLSC